MLSGDNGILQKATDAKTETEKGQEKEIVVLAYNSALAKKVGNGDSTPVTSEDMNKELTNQGATATGSNVIKVTFEKSKRQYTIKSNGIIEYAGLKNEDEQDDNELPTALGTKPYLPSDKFSQLDGTTLENGLVITDKSENEEFGNEYVWIEVPSTYVDSSSTNGPNYESVTNTTEGEDSYYIAIENALIAYVENDLLTGNDDKTSRASCKDEWYDRYNATVIGTTVAGDKYGKVKAITSSNYSTAKSYYGTSLYTNSELTTQAGDNFTSGTTYYAKLTETLLGDINGCGLSYSAYNIKKKTMLESIYKNGGFWIGRYEAGQTGDTGRINDSVTIDGIIPLSKPNLIPIFYVTCSQSQQIASRINNIGNYNSSLMFGIQWDLVLKHLKNKGVATSLLIGDSSSWGNYLNTTNAELIRGKYARSQVVSFRTIWS